MVARPLTRICLFGPESTGKTTLARDLAAHFGAGLVPEFARAYLEQRDGAFTYPDMEAIGRGQLALQQKGESETNGLLFCDTDLLTTTLWSRWFFGRCSPWLEKEAAAQTFDLTLLTCVDVPWVADIVRYLPEEREAFYGQCVQALRAHRREFVTVAGDWDQRREKAVVAVERLLRA